MSSGSRGRRAQDLVSEAELWHLVCEVSDRCCPSNAPHSTLPTSAQTPDEHCAPLDDEALFASAVHNTRTFRTAIHFPCFASLNEMAALRVLGTAMAHGARTDAEVKNAALGTAAAYRNFYGRCMEKAEKISLYTYLKQQNAATDNDQALLETGAFFRHTFAANPRAAETWNAEALQHADAWQSTFRCSRSDSEAWSAYLHTMAACGAMQRDPALVQRLVQRVAGAGAGNHKSLDAFVNSFDVQPTEAMHKNAVRSTLLQAAHLHALSTEDNVHLV